MLDNKIPINILKLSGGMQHRVPQRQELLSAIIGWEGCLKAVRWG